MSSKKFVRSELVNQLVEDVSNYNVNNMIFSEPEKSLIPGSSFYSHRINICTKNPDGTIGDLILPTTGELFSFGLQENHDLTTKKLNGYSMSLVLYNKDGPTKEEKEWVDTFNKICEKCKDNVIAQKDAAGKHELERAELRKLNPLYWKKEKGVVVPGTGPTLYPKLLVSKGKAKKDKSDSKEVVEEPKIKIVSMFFDPEGNEIADPLKFLGTYCYTKAAVKIESIFFGASITLQVKLYEATVRPASTKMKPLLARSKTSGLLKSDISKPLSRLTINEPGSLENSDDEAVKPAEKPSLVVDDDIVDDAPEEPKEVVRNVKKVATRKATTKKV